MSVNKRFESSTLKVVKSYIQFTAGSSGAVPAITAVTRGNDISGLSLAATGKYSFALKAGWTALCDYSFQIKQAGTFDAAKAVRAQLITDNVAGASPSVTFQVTDAAGTAIALASGDIVRVSLDLKKSAGLA